MKQISPCRHQKYKQVSDMSLLAHFTHSYFNINMVFTLPMTKCCISINSGHSLSMETWRSCSVDTAVPDRDKRTPAKRLGKLQKAQLYTNMQWQSWAGWQPVRITLIPTGTKAESVYYRAGMNFKQQRKSWSRSLRFLIIYSMCLTCEVSYQDSKKNHFCQIADS